MHRQHTTIAPLHILTRRLLTLIGPLLLWTALSASAQGKEHTIVVACDWDFAPYEYINSDGHSSGYNIDVLHTILKRLGRPHQFVMKARKQSIEAFEEGQADLIIDYADRFNNPRYSRTRSIIEYYGISIASRKGVSPVTEPAELNGCGKVVLNSSNDSIAMKFLGHYADAPNIAFRTAREALAGVESGELDFFIWGQETMKWKIKELNLHGISQSNFNLPAGEIRIVGYDKELIDEIDSQFARLQQSGEIDKIHNQWFQPTKVPKSISLTPIYIMLAVILLSIVAVIIYRFIMARVRVAVRNNHDTETMLQKALNMGDYSVMIYDLRDQYVTNYYGHVLPDKGISAAKFVDGVHPEDRHAINLLTHRMKNGEVESSPFSMRWNASTPAHPVWLNVAGHMFTEKKDGQVTHLVITTRNITGEVLKEREEQELTKRYIKMFDSTLVAMSFYDKDGRLIDLNENMKELCGIQEENISFFKQTNIFETGMLKGVFLPDTLDNFHVCQHMLYPEINIDKYIELRIRRTLDENGDTSYYIITARDVTEERNMYQELRRQNIILRQTEETNNLYEQEMRTLLENCNMYVWRLDMETGLITFSRSLNKVDFSRPLEEHLQSMFEEDRQAALSLAQNLNGINKTFNVLHHFHFTPIDNTPTWYAISGMPLTNNEGRLTSLFGIVRDVTDLMETQERLKEETARAENSAMLKATFLANMTHEIRTPLNAIVGFSDLLHMVNTTEERKEFIRIIRNNCDMLLRLINDIFEASTMDIKPLEIVPEEVDFAFYFNDICQSLRQRVQEPGVEFIVENPFSTFITYLDKGRMQQVITNFVTNAVKYTHEGHIRVGYRYEDNGIYMYCEDTGAGIPKNKQQRVFDRFVKLNDFVQGTGLGLSICKSIAERSNGRIGVESEGEGHGSTFWIWVPCPMLSQAVGG